MKHYIIVKLKDRASKDALIDPVQRLFDETLTIRGIYGVKVKPCCIDRPNRYDLMIEIEMEKDSLALYDVSEPHKTWKKVYGDLIEAKTIFDCED